VINVDIYGGDQDYAHNQYKKDFEKIGFFFYPKIDLHKSNPSEIYEDITRIYQKIR
jgi:hypothetical protein